MQFESQWPGDAIAAPFRPSYDRGDAFFEGLGRSWNRVDSRADQAEADTTAVVLKDRRNAVIKPAPGWSAPSSQRLRRGVAVNRPISHTDPVKWLSQPNLWGRWVGAVMSLAIDRIIEGFALSATTLPPDFRWPAGEYTGRRDLVKDRASARRAEAVRANFPGQRASITSITSILTGLWSRMRREHEIRRIRAAWEMIDDRTLKDIGISRYEIEYARDARYWG